MSSAEFEELKKHAELGKSHTPEGWQFVCYEAPYYEYQKGDYKNGFKVMKLLKEDLTTENIQLMIKYNVTR